MYIPPTHTDSLSSECTAKTQNVQIFVLILILYIVLFNKMSVDSLIPVASVVGGIQIFPHQTMFIQI